MKQPPSQPVGLWRLVLVEGFVCLLFALLLWKILSLQVLDTDRGYEFLRSQGEKRFLREAIIPAYRGSISDRHGEILAVSTPVSSLWANPRLLATSVRLPELATALGRSPEKLREQLQSYSTKSFMYLQRHMQPSRAREIMQLEIYGVGESREYQRYYPAAALAAHLVGFTDLDDRGIAGMELAYEKSLRGLPGKKQVIKNERGVVVREVGELEAARPGRNLSLSIDLRLQYVAHQELQRAIVRSGAESGSIVTLDVHSGEVLAVVNHPVYNPNNRSRVNPGWTRNRALVDAFEPGSVLKPLLVAAALEAGQFTPDTVLDTSPGSIQVGRKVIVDPVNYGESTVARVLAKSSQVGIVKMALQLDPQDVWKMYRKFGLGLPMGTGFPGESAGTLEFREHWRDIERATVAYGHGLRVTPLQLAVAFAAIANGGWRHQASLTLVNPAEVESERIMDKALALQLRDMLEGVTAAGGTGRRAQVEGFRVAGKTGTAHKAAAGGYAKDRYLSLFAGLAPASRPRLVTVVMINEPKGEHYHGGVVAAPVFSEVMGAALRLLNIAPDQYHPPGAVK